LGFSSCNFLIIGYVSISECKLNNRRKQHMKKRIMAITLGLMVGLGFSFFQTADASSNITIKKGDTLYSLAKKNDMTVEELKLVNNLKSNTIYAGKSLKVKDSNEVVIKKGDTLYSLAKKHKTTVETLKTLNKLKSNTIYVGQLLIVKTELVKVQKGDTLYSLAKKYKTTVKELKSLNNLKNNTIYIGQTLKVSK
jgi:LysM repeat protein